MSKLFDVDEVISDVIESNDNLILDQVTYDLFKIIYDHKYDKGLLGYSREDTISSYIKEAYDCKRILVNYGIVKGDVSNDS